MTATQQLRAYKEALIVAHDADKKVEKLKPEISMLYDDRTFTINYVLVDHSTTIWSLCIETGDSKAAMAIPEELLIELKDRLNEWWPK